MLHLYCIAFVATLVQGSGIFYYKNGDKYEGQWDEDKRHGRGRMVYASGDMYDGMWSAGLREGVGILTLGTLCNPILVVIVLRSCALPGRRETHDD